MLYPQYFWKKSDRMGTREEDMNGEGHCRPGFREERVGRLTSIRWSRQQFPLTKPDLSFLVPWHVTSLCEQPVLSVIISFNCWTTLPFLSFDPMPLFEYSWSWTLNFPGEKSVEPLFLYGFFCQETLKST